MSTERRRTLITGAGGFVGRHLVKRFERARHDVLALSRRPATFDAARTATCTLGGDGGAFGAIVSDFSPNLVCHLAGPTTDVPSAIAEAQAATEDLMAACASLARPPLVVLVSSSAVYGMPARRSPIPESAIPAPASYNGIAKLTAELLARRVAERHGVPLIRARLFNVIGPGQHPHRVPAAFAEQIAAIEAAAAAPILRVRNLAAVRDYVDARDAASALELLAKRGAAGAIYNVCSGVGATPGDLLSLMLAKSRVRDILVARQDDRDISWQVGRAAPLGALGWKPRVSHARSAIDTLDDFRRRRSS